MCRFEQRQPRARAVVSRTTPGHRLDAPRWARWCCSAPHATGQRLVFGARSLPQAPTANGPRASGMHPEPAGGSERHARSAQAQPLVASQRWRIRSGGNHAPQRVTAVGSRRTRQNRGLSRLSRSPTAPTTPLAGPSGASSFGGRLSIVGEKRTLRVKDFSIHSSAPPKMARGIASACNLTDGCLVVKSRSGDGLSVSRRHLPGGAIAHPADGS
jgi:hypothetical protein